MSLDAYHKKRRFDETSEPRGELCRSPGRSFVVQKHHASRLHYDLRLEMEGVLRSWAVPKGPSLDPEEKRLAVQTEDHPVDYGDFEGIIPPGNYGAGKVIVWDHGTYEMVDPTTAEEGWLQHKFHITLEGKKLRGEWVLVKTGRGDDKRWLFFKVRDAFASSDDITESRPESVISGLRVEDVGSEGAATRRLWHSKVEKELERQGVKGSRRAKFPEKVSPMLATLVEKPFDDDEWLFEIKLDGVRAVVFKNGDTIELRSRNQNSMTRRFPRLVRAFEALPVDSAVIDGEIVALDENGRSRFSLIQPRIHLSRDADVRAAESSIAVYFYAFDLLYINGYSLTGRPLEDRKTLLRKFVPEKECWIRYSDHVEGRGMDFFEAAEAHGLEGVVAKRKRSTYHQRRTRQWLKIKTTRVEDFVIVGFMPSADSRRPLGALVLGLYDGEGRIAYTGRVGSGFDDSGLETAISLVEPLLRETPPFREVPKELSRARWVDPRLVCEVRFSEWTSDGKLRAPVFERFRDDIDPQSCVLRIADTGERSVEPDLRTETSASTGRSNSLQDLPGGTSPRFTNLEKVFWPEDGFTKGDLIHYYGEISEYIVPYLRDRPLVLKRYPDGIKGEYFYQKDAPEHTPDWVRIESVWSEDVERSIRYFVGADRELLMYLANLGSITQNPWSSRSGRLDYPDYVIFDLDPAPGLPYLVVQKVALELKKVLDELELRAYPKTSGASGIHVYLPLLEDRFAYGEVRTFAEAISSIVVQRLPELATIERVVRRRPKSVYVDYLQNVRGKTVASVYSPRARAAAPVSTPLDWEEFERTLDPTKFNMENIFRRLRRVGDLFRPTLTDRQDIAGFLKALGAQ